MSSRPRQRRTRFTSGSTVDEASCRPKKVHMSPVHQCKSQCNEQHTSLPSSPNSPYLDSANMLFHNSDIGLSNYVNQKDIPVDRPDAAEDENSFASSMFSEKLVQPELNLAIEPTSTTDHESLNHENSSVGNRLLNSHSSTMRDSDSHVNMDGILMQSERMVLTPSAVATDEAGSSEGEYENEGHDSNIRQANSSIHHSACRNRTGKSSLVGTSCSQPLELVESESQESTYSNSTKASVLDSISPKLTECSSERPGNLSTRSSNTNKPNEFLESSTSNCFVALVKCSSPLEILSNQTLPGTADCRQSASCFRKSSALTNANNYRVCSSNDKMVLTTCHSCCSHRCTNRNYDENEVKPVPCSSADQLSQHDFHPAIKLADFSRESQHNGVVIKSESPSVFSAAGNSSNNFLSNQHQLVKKCEVFSENVPSFSPASSEMSTTCDKNCGNRHNSVCDSPVPHCVNNIQSPESESHNYPLRSRLRQTFLRQQWEALQTAPKSLGQLPTEVMFRIIHYLSIQDVFRLQRVNRRFKAIMEQYLLLVKRINFSNGLPFAFLPESITDMTLKRILSRTPEVTHILGFYPRKIVGSYPSDGQYSSISSGYNSLTYVGVIAAFRLCPKLRSVELMDVELMSELVRHHPRIKFHGMFRNRPDSWDCEYAVPLPPEPNNEAIEEISDQDPPTNVTTQRDTDSNSKPQYGSFLSTLFCSATSISAIKSSYGRRKASTRLKSKGHTGCECAVPSFNLATAAFSLSPPCKNGNHHSLTKMAIHSAHKISLRHANFANWFEPVGELPLGQGSPSTAPHFLPSRLFTAFNGGPILPVAQENASNNPMPSVALDCYSNAIESLRNMAVSHFMQPGLPPIEGELIAVAPFGYSRCSLHALGSNRNSVRNALGPVLAFAFGAIFVPPQPASPLVLPPNSAQHCRLIDVRQYNGFLLGAGVLRGAQGRHLAFERILNFPQNVNPIIVGRQIQLQDLALRRNQQRQPLRHRRQRTNTNLNASGPWLVSPLPSQMQWIVLPHVITNLTKLDLVSVSISGIPRLDNIKYLHLKWVIFSSADPFFSFLAPKLQSFVMNNCSTPTRVVRFLRIFSALSRAPQLTRLELVGVRFIEGLIGRIIEDTISNGRGFRNLQRLVLSSNRDASEVDIGLLLLAGQQSLNQVALQMMHTKNSLFESLYHAGAEFPRLESLTLGYLDPYQSRITVSELTSLGIGESADHVLPICAITDWGLALAFFISPRLINITIRNAPYLKDIARWFSASFCGEEPLHHIEPTVQPSSSANNNNVDPLVQQTATNSTTEQQSTQSCGMDSPSKTHSLPLRSLNLENCPGISVETLERAINTGHPFPCLETIVLRNMFVAQYGERKDFLQTSSVGTTTTTTTVNESIDWRKLSHLLALSDLLAARQFGYSPLSPEGIGLGSSIRDVIHINPPRNFMPDSLRTKPNDLFCSLRAHTYLNSLLELDGSCGWSMLSSSQEPMNRVAKTLFSDTVHIPVSNNTEASPEMMEDNSSPPDFISQSTQTCICGMLEWDVMLRMFQSRLTVDTKAPRRSSCNSKASSSSSSESVTSTPDTSSPSSCSGRNSLLRSAATAAAGASSSSQNNTESQTTASTSDGGTPTVTSTTTNNNNGMMPQLIQLGGIYAFHPYPPSIQHKMLCKVITASEWTQLIFKMSPLFGLPSGQIVHPVTGSNECSGCASDPLLYSQGIINYQISAPCKEPSQRKLPSKWLARDACIDTSELRCFSLPKPQILTIHAVHSCLTSLHFEKVGISHLILSEAPHLKNITLENCTELRAILFNNEKFSTSHLATYPPTSKSSSSSSCSSSSSSSTTMTTDDAAPKESTVKRDDPLPALRRIRIINCPKFAIYNFLYSVAKLYPVHNENLSITYRPFGQYNSGVERALWDYCQHAHIFISHDNKINESERAMEECHSTFDQLFRDVMTFSDMAIRRDLFPVYPKPTEVLKNAVQRRRRYGDDWDFVTDIPWVHEVCCSLLGYSGESRRSPKSDQLYELLSEYQAIASLSVCKFQRHGIHLHVQCRNVHSSLSLSTVTPPPPPSPTTPTPTSSVNEEEAGNSQDDNACPLHPHPPPPPPPPRDKDLSHFTPHKRKSYINWPYTNKMLLVTHPSNDPNTMKYVLKEKLPTTHNAFIASTSRTKDNSGSDDDNNKSHKLPWQRLLLSQEERVSGVVKPPAYYIPVALIPSRFKRKANLPPIPDDDDVVVDDNADDDSVCRRPVKQNCQESIYSTRNHNDQSLASLSSSSSSSTPTTSTIITTSLPSGNQHLSTVPSTSASIQYDHHHHHRSGGGVVVVPRKRSLPPSSSLWLYSKSCKKSKQ